jgi:hypothetical protein
MDRKHLALPCLVILLPDLFPLFVMADRDPRLSDSLGQFDKARSGTASSSPSPVIPRLDRGTHGREMA